ncbi:hypothetical protein [Methylobacterium sp. JK268]
MIRTATLIAALAALAAYLLVPPGRSASRGPAPAKLYTERLPVAAFLPTPQDLLVFALEDAARGVVSR